VRVAQAADPLTGERKVQRMPQALTLQREYVFEKNDNDEQAPDQTPSGAATDRDRVRPTVIF
jgi:hypothetical protein